MLTQLGKLRLEGLKPLNKGSFSSIKDEFQPSLDLQGFKALRDKAGRERDLRELYRERAPYELLQNADDAHATKVAYILTDMGIAFIHNGDWFTVNNFRSLADGWSDKDPKECIGHKGLGFRSVLDITPSPFIISLNVHEFFAVKFSWALNNGHIQIILQKDPKANNEYQRSTKNGQLVCPIMAIPGEVSRDKLGACEKVYKSVVKGDFGQGYTTMFWFPAKDMDLDKRALEDLNPIPLQADIHGISKLMDFLEDEVCILLPFLASINEVNVYQNDIVLGKVSVERDNQGTQHGKVSVKFIKGTNTNERTYYQSRCNVRIPIEIKAQPDTPRALQQMEEVSIVLMVEIKDRHPIYQPNSEFHVYFPTEEQTGLGFVVHGDFYVKPDRTRLMLGKYNEWLLSVAAKLAANDFLSNLLKEYLARDVFSALAPSNENPTSSSESFVGMFADALRRRKEPFVQSREGLLTSGESLLPPQIDTSGFWDTHFCALVPEIFPGKKAFLLPEHDSGGTRKFLKLAGIEPLRSESFIRFLDARMQARHVSPDELYEYYEYMCTDPDISRYDHDALAGHRLLLVSDSIPYEIPVGSVPLICFPPAIGEAEEIVPPLFSKVFLFLDSRLSSLLDNGVDRVKSWVMDRLKVLRFEASELLPRTIRGIVAEMYYRDTPVSHSELSQIWIFIKHIIEASPRKILDPDFWKEIGRLPLPTGTNNVVSTPAFLAYWPDDFVNGSSSLQGISGIRKIEKTFLDVLIANSQQNKYDWVAFFEQAGVSTSLKVLTYTRLIGSDQSLLLNLSAPQEYQRERFTGERQADENRAVAEALANDQVWGKYLTDIPLCRHSSPREIQQLSVMDGFNQSVEQAHRDYQENRNEWQERLLDLLTDLPEEKPGREDKVFCPAGGQGGHQEGVSPYVSYQLKTMPWVPTTWGPRGSSDSFSRLITRHFISPGHSEKPIGDELLPYVVANGISDLTKYERYGIELLEDPESATTSTLTRALKVLGQKLSSDWGRTEIIGVKGRWRLVRGAIQEVYRRLNQVDFKINSDTLLAARVENEIRFVPTPLYYADPGSPVEQAFIGLLPLFDSDQVYAKLFRQTHVIQLIPGETVDEVFESEDLAAPAQNLQKEIVEGIAPYLLAPLIARSERTKQIKALPRRLVERFSVRAAEKIKVSFALKTDTRIRKEVEYRSFYPKRIITPGQGATTEIGYVLYVKGDVKISIGDLDADALGEALARVFLDGFESGSDLTGLFPRITLRYKETGGGEYEMRDYLLHQLGISIEAQEEAHAMLSLSSKELPPLSSPPARIVWTQHGHNGDGGKNDLPNNYEEQIRGHQEDLTEATNRFITDLHQSVSDKFSQNSEIAKEKKYKGHSVSLEQEARGRKGELEILRRLQLPGGWDGITLYADRREESVGYDFQCIINGRTVYLEVKTFIFGGQVIMTSSELQAAASHKEDFYLVGLLDNGNQENEWKAFLLPNPLILLLDEGEFDVQPRLHIPAKKVFDPENIYFGN
jgi:hypothetical protein